MKIPVPVVVLLLATFLAVETRAQRVLKYVNPDIGTAHSRWFFYTPAAVGHRMPSVQ